MYPVIKKSRMGNEKLQLQGIPPSRMLLTCESEVQKSDMAGNAMSVPIVGAVELAAMCAPELRRQRMKNKTVKLASFALKQKYDSAKGAVLAERGDLFSLKSSPRTRDFTDVFSEVLPDIGEDAFRSSVLCTCESSGRLTKEPKILQCKGCGWSVCHDCSGKYQTEGHDLHEINVTGKNGRPDPHFFERRLRCAVPSILTLGKGCEQALGDENEALASYSFQIQNVKREKGHWQLVYGAYEDHGAGRQVAEIRVLVGKVATLDKDVGVAAYIKCFGPAIRDDPVRGKLNDSARLVWKLSQSSETPRPEWEAPDKKTKCSLKIVGSGTSGRAATISFDFLDTCLFLYVHAYMLWNNDLLIN